MTFDIPPKAPPRACRSCSATIYWIQTDKGRLMPVDPDGTSHFATCPNASEHRKPRAKARKESR